LRARTADIGPGLALQLYGGLQTLDPQLAIRSAEVLHARATSREERLWRVRVARLRAKNGEAGVLEALAASGLDDDPVAWIELSDAYGAQRHWDAAHAALDRALELDPKCAEALVSMFTQALVSGDAGMLERAAQTLPAVKPNWHQSPEHLARMLARRGDPAGVKHAKRAAGMAPYCHNAWLAVGESQLVAGDLDDARAALARAQQITPPEPPDAMSILGAALAGDAAGLERELAERYKHLPALPFPAFVEKLREVARAPRMP
jgi:tetratricopeptide (TPR) repeat protein